MRHHHRLLVGILATALLVLGIVRFVPDDWHARLRGRIQDWQVAWEFRQYAARARCGFTEVLTGCRTLPARTGPLAASTDSALGANPRLDCQRFPFRGSGEYRFARPPFGVCQAWVADTSLSLHIAEDGRVVIVARAWRNRDPEVAYRRIHDGFAARYGPGYLCPPSDVPVAEERRWRLDARHHLAVL
ncbi:MAG TPA: hypothetical protein VFY16_11590, partial [Gemmatimonadaceae bacterium]|nr:hypothetical protein [Gemmatimonadaceae bacterium]